MDQIIIIIFTAVIGFNVTTLLNAIQDALHNRRKKVWNKHENKKKV